MIVVADASPLHYLILLDQIALLEQLYGSVFVPEAVAAELRAALAQAGSRLSCRSICTGGSNRPTRAATPSERGEAPSKVVGRLSS